MSKKEAIGLVFEAVEKSIGGEIFVMRMPATSVKNMADALVILFGNDKTNLKVIGARPGEKIDEVLVSKNESPFTKILDEKYFVILPQQDNPELLDRYDDYPNIDTESFDSRNTRQLSVNDLVLELEKEKWLMDS
jgi:FlaA1/EpsC-like NDP-sugar epimerase